MPLENSSPQSAAEKPWRLFIAIALPEEIQRQMIELSRNLQKGFQFTPSHPSWAAIDGTHLTLAFLGNKEARQVEPIGRMLDEVGAGFAVKDMTGFDSNDCMHNENGKVVFDSNNAGGITGGLSTGQDIVVRLTVKPTPTIDRPQRTIDKYTLENTDLAAITRRDPTIVGRIWPVAENYTAMVILDNLIAHYGYEAIKQKG